MPRNKVFPRGRRPELFVPVGICAGIYTKTAHCQLVISLISHIILPPKMLKKSPRTESDAVWDRKIGAALAFIRNRDAQQTQAVFAQRMGISRSLLANIERGRTPLTVCVGVNACRIFDIDPLWLCQGGKGGSGFFPEIHADKLEKIETHLRAVGSAPLRDVWPSLVWFIKDSADDGKKNLTKTTTFYKIRAVINQWSSLKRRIQNATTKSGARSKLANYLDVDLTQLSKWLTDADSAREPGAEYTLRMLYWVKHPELQK